MSGCLKPISGLWSHKTGACLIEVHLHHTGKCKSTGAGCNELVPSKLRTGVRLKWRKR